MRCGDSSVGAVNALQAFVHVGALATRAPESPALAPRRHEARIKDEPIHAAASHAQAAAVIVKQEPEPEYTGVYAANAGRADAWQLQRFRQHSRRQRAPRRPKPTTCHELLPPARPAPSPTRSSCWCHVWRCDVVCGGTRGRATDCAGAAAAGAARRHDDARVPALEPAQARQPADRRRCRVVPNQAVPNVARQGSPAAAVAVLSTAAGGAARRAAHRGRVLWRQQLVRRWPVRCAFTLAATSRESPSGGCFPSAATGLTSSARPPLSTSAGAHASAPA